jgi:benzoyl-CoA reductase subunit C
MDFKKMVADRHEYAKAWKARTGGKVVGWFEGYFPEEIAYAAGMLPVRVMGPHEPDSVSDKYLYGACYPCRDIASQFLAGRYDYVDAAVCVEGCQWMYSAFEAAANTQPGLESYYLFVPDYVDAPTSKHVARSEFDLFRKWLQEFGGREITDAAIDDAIETYNKNRLLLKRICEMRRQERPVVTGSEMMSVVFADQVMDKKEMNVLLEQFIDELDAREPGADKIRLMLIGSETYDFRLEEIVESCGADIVVDETDNGSSYFWNNVVPQKDRMMALGMRYLGKPHTALRDNNNRRRPQHICELAEDYNVDGALLAKQVYCHSHGSDMYAVWKTLRERNIPYHYFERTNVLPEEETRMRVESLLAMIKPGATHMAGWHKQPFGVGQGG